MPRFPNVSLARALLGAGLLVAATAPTFTGPSGQDLGVRIGYYALLVSSWNILAGYAGIYSFGHVAFASLGAYSTVVIVMRWHIANGYAFVIGGVVAAAVGLLLGLLSCRIRGPYLVVASFGLLVGVKTVILANPAQTGGASGSVVPLLGGFDTGLRFYGLGLFLLLLFLLVSALLLRSRAGLALAAIRDDEDGAIAIGLDPRPWKIAVFAYTSLWAGVAGVFIAYYTGFVTPSIGSVSEMSTVAAMSIVGGLGQFLGPLASTAALLYLSDRLRNAGAGYSSLLFGAALLICVVGLPVIKRQLRKWAHRPADHRALSPPESERAAPVGSGSTR
jgi:branched-chain amino acid transport system permease protein